MEVVLITILLFFVLLFTKLIMKVMSVSFNAVSNVATHTSTLLDDTKENAIERYKYACEILELYKPYLTNDEYQELHNIVNCKDRVVDIRTEEESYGINIRLQLQAKNTKMAIESKKIMDKRVIPEIFKDFYK